ncbi:diphthine synthase [Candidatus Bathyarchaeota archaeon]|nr:diphthine synthase [Candidatus Bathyarchaeota archaeon]
MTLSLISIGLTDEKDLSIRAVEEARGCDRLYAELYTMKLETTIAGLEEAIRKPVTPLLRGDLEEKADAILEEAKRDNVGVLVGGDCLSATTHISLIIDAKKRGIETRVIHGSSIFTAIAETGLSLYKFGRTVTMPLPEKGPTDTVLKTIDENLEHGLHTLILLDLDVETSRFVTVDDALSGLIEAGLDPSTLVVGAARLSSRSQRIAAGRAVEVKKLEFGEPPHSIVVPGSLHFLEEEALKTLAACPQEALKGRIVKGELDRLIEKYAKGCRRVLDELKLAELPATINEVKVEELREHAKRYLSDAEYYAADTKPTALTGVAYAEGILDALRLLGLAEFEW